MADLAPEDREFLIRVDSVCSLVASRYPADCPPDVVQELKNVSYEARRRYEPRVGTRLPHSNG